MLLASDVPNFIIMELKKSFFLVLFLSFYLFSKSQTSPVLKTRKDTIQLLTNLTAENNWVTSIAISYGGEPSKQYYRFLFLLTILKNEEIVDLTKSSNGCLRLYGYMGLLHNHYKRIDEIECMLSSDTTQITTMSGCVIEKVSIRNAIKRITDWYWEEPTNKVLELIKTSSLFQKREFEDVINPDY